MLPIEPAAYLSPIPTPTGGAMIDVPISANIPMSGSPRLLILVPSFNTITPGALGPESCPYRLANSVSTLSTPPPLSTTLNNSGETAWPGTGAAMTGFNKPASPKGVPVCWVALGPKLS